MLYQGGFSVDRGVEELVAAIDQPALRGAGRGGRVHGLRSPPGVPGRRPPRAHPERVYVLPAVPPDELLGWTSGADVSFVGQPPRTLNQRMNLPNKLFESIMAGRPGGGERGQRAVPPGDRGGAVGRCADIDDPAAIAAACADLLSAAPDERRTLRAHCREVALARYTWDHTAAGLIEVYRKLAHDGALEPAVHAVRDGGSPRAGVDQ